MGPQNADPNTSTGGSQPDLNSVLGSTTPASVTPQPDPIVPIPQEPVPLEPTTAPVLDPTSNMPPVPTSEPVISDGFGSLPITSAPVNPPTSDSTPLPTPPVPEIVLPQPDPVAALSSDPPAPQLDPSSVISDPIPAVEPTPTPEPAPISTDPSSLGTSSLDNPMNMPSQTQPLDGGASNDLNSGFSWSNNTSQTPLPNPVAPDPYATPDVNTSPQANDAAPTDLSQLSGLTPEPQNIYTPPMSQPETLVVPTATPDATTLQTETTEHKLPKWVWGLGVALVLVVIIASAYFILGVGQAPKPASIPASDQPAALIAPPLPTPVTQAQPTAAPSASSSTGFGGVGGGTSSPSPSSTSTDILKAKLTK